MTFVKISLVTDSNRTPHGALCEARTALSAQFRVKTKQRTYLIHSSLGKNPRRLKKKGSEKLPDYFVDC
jgi:hypothetical protein